MVRSPVGIVAIGSESHDDRSFTEVVCALWRHRGDEQSETSTAKREYARSMARLCDIERCYNNGSYKLEGESDYQLCTKHEHEWRESDLRLRANAKKHTLRLVEVTVADGY